MQSEGQTGVRKVPGDVSAYTGVRLPCIPPASSPRPRPLWSCFWLRRLSADRTGPIALGAADAVSPSPLTPQAAHRGQDPLHWPQHCEDRGPLPHRTQPPREQGGATATAGSVLPSPNGGASDRPLPAMDPTRLAPFLAHLVYTHIQNKS